MNRREFLKWAGVTVVAAPSLAKAEKYGAKAPAYYTHEDVFRDFDPSQVYGNYVELTDSMKTSPGFPEVMPMIERKRIYRVVEDNMNLSIPPKYRHKVTYLEKECFPNDEGIKATLAWKYKP